MTKMFCNQNDERKTAVPQSNCDCVNLDQNCFMYDSDEDIENFSFESNSDDDAVMNYLSHFEKMIAKKRSVLMETIPTTRQRSYLERFNKNFDGKKTGGKERSELSDKRWIDGLEKTRRRRNKSKTRRARNLSRVSNQRNRRGRSHSQVQNIESTESENRSDRSESQRSRIRTTNENMDPTDSEYGRSRNLIRRRNSESTNESSDPNDIECMSRQVSEAGRGRSRSKRSTSTNLLIDTNESQSKTGTDKNPNKTGSERERNRSKSADEWRNTDDTLRCGRNRSKSADPWKYTDNTPRSGRNRSRNKNADPWQDKAYSQRSGRNRGRSLDPWKDIDDTPRSGRNRSRSKSADLWIDTNVTPRSGAHRSRSKSIDPCRRKSVDKLKDTYETRNRNRSRSRSRCRDRDRDRGGTVKVTVMPITPHSRAHTSHCLSLAKQTNESPQHQILVVKEGLVARMGLIAKALKPKKPGRTKYFQRYGVIKPYTKKPSSTENSTENLSSTENFLKMQSADSSKELFLNTKESVENALQIDSIISKEETKEKNPHRICPNSPTVECITNEMTKYFQLTFLPDKSTNNIKTDLVDSTDQTRKLEIEKMQNKETLSKSKDNGEKEFKSCIKKPMYSKSKDNENMITKSPVTSTEDVMSSEADPKKIKDEEVKNDVGQQDTPKNFFARRKKNAKKTEIESKLKDKLKMSRNKKEPDRYNKPNLVDLMVRNDDSIITENEVKMNQVLVASDSMERTNNTKEKKRSFFQARSIKSINGWLASKGSSTKYQQVDSTLKTPVLIETAKNNNVEKNTPDTDTTERISQTIKKKNQVEILATSDSIEATCSNEDNEKDSFNVKSYPKVEELTPDSIETIYNNKYVVKTSSKREDGPNSQATLKTMDGKKQEIHTSELKRNEVDCERAANDLTSFAKELPHTIATKKVMTSSQLTSIENGCQEINKNDESCGVPYVDPFSFRFRRASQMLRVGA